MLLPRAVPVTLTAAERTTLKKRARGATTAYRDRLRAQIVLAAARGRDNARIAADLRVTADTVRKWRGRFAVRGLAGLADLPRCGRPRRISELTRAAVVAPGWSPHSVLSEPAQRPARGSSPGATGRVAGAHPIDGYPRLWSACVGTRCSPTKAHTSASLQRAIPVENY